MLVLGALQGVFEWLPVSSKGQIMALAMSFFKLNAETSLRYAVMLHLGTLLSAVFYFRTELKELFLLKNRPLLKFLAIAVFATGITAVPCYMLLKILITNYNASSFIFLIGFLLIIAGFLQLKKQSKLKGSISTQNAIILGLAQGFSALPGISRSGITTSALLLRGFQPEQAFRLSFLLSIPSILIAVVAFSVLEPVAFDLNAIFAMLIAFALGLLLIDILIKAARKINFSIFCIAFGIIYMAIAMLELIGS